VDASSAVDMTARDRTLVGPLLRSPADTGAGRVRRNARGIRARDRRRRAVGVGGDAGGGNARRGNAGGGRRSGIGRTAISKADDLGTSDNESIKRIGPDVGPVESIVHSGEGGEIAGRWLVSASVLHVHLNAAGVVLWLSSRVKRDDLIADQVLPGGEPSGNIGGPLVTISDQLLRGPLPIRVSTLIDLKPFTIGSLERGAVPVAGGHEGRNRSQVIAGPLGESRREAKSDGRNGKRG